RLLDLPGEVIAARSAAGEAHVAHGSEAALEMVEKRRLARNAPKQKMLCSVADDGVENRILAMRDRIDLDHFTIGAWPVILRKLAERPLGLANLGQNAALDDDFGMRRHAYPVGAAFRHFHRPAEQRAGDLHFVLVERSDRLRSQNAGRMHADHK